MRQNPDAQEDVILNLIDNVDKNFEKRMRHIYFSRKTEFGYFLPFIALATYLIIFLSAGYLLLNLTRALPVLSQQPESTQLAVYISITAALIALASFSINIPNAVKSAHKGDILFRHNYKVLKADVAEKDLALLKGLVMIKSKHPELSLNNFLELPITKDKMFEMLYK